MNEYILSTIYPDIRALRWVLFYNITLRLCLDEGLSVKM